MGRTKQALRAPSKKITIGTDRWLCVICNKIVKRGRGGIESHKRGQTHQQNLRRRVSTPDINTVTGYESAEFEGYASEDGTVFYETDYDQTSNPVHYYKHVEQVATYQQEESRSADIDKQADEEAPPGVAYVDSTPTSPLDPFTIYIQKHFYSGSRQPTASRLQPSMKDAAPPYWPFNSLLDFKHAEECIEEGFSEPRINRHLALAHETQGGTGPLTLKTAKELFETLDRAVMFDEDKFLDYEIETEYAKKTFKHTLRARNLDQLIRGLLGDPELENFWTFDAEKRYMARPDGTPMRVYEEYHHGEDMWAIQTAMGPKTSPILLSVYADATQLTSFGNVKLWTVYVALANLPTCIRNSKGKGGYTLVGYLPEVKEPPEIPKSQIANYRCAVYHNCWHRILSSIYSAARFGSVYQLGRERRFHGTPIVALKVADYPEGCLMACNRGPNAEFGCLVGLIPSASFGDFGHQCPARDSNIAQTAAEKAIQGNKRAGDGIPKPEQLGDRVVKNAFDDVTNKYFANHRTFGVDDLHMFDSGAYGRTLVPDTLSWLHNPPYPEINKAFSSLPKYPGLKHYKDGWCALKWKSGEDWKAISRLFPPVLDAILPASRHRKKVIQLFRLYGEFRVLLGFKTHTEMTLEKMGTVLERAAGLHKELHNALEFRTITPKLHYIHTHTIQSIKDKGPAHNTSTSFGEARHPESKDDFEQTNGQSGKFETSMLKVFLRRQSLENIRDAVDMVNENDRPAAPSPSHDYHVKLGSPEPATTLNDLFKSLPISKTFPKADEDKLVSSLQKCLYHSDNTFKDRKRLSEISVLKITPHKCAHIVYVSLHNHETVQEIIRVTPKWYGKGPRYDFVLVNLNNQSLSCAQVHFLFTLKVDEDTTLQIALIRILKSLARNGTTGYIHASESSDYQFVTTACFVRSIFVHPPSEGYSRRGSIYSWAGTKQGGKIKVDQPMGGPVGSSHAELYNKSEVIRS